jgi:hypothetical protein
MALRDVDDATVLGRVKRSPARGPAPPRLTRPPRGGCAFARAMGQTDASGGGSEAPDVHCRSMLLFASTPSSIRILFGQRGRSVTPSCNRSVTHLLSGPRRDRDRDRDGDGDGDESPSRGGTSAPSAQPTCSHDSIGSRPSFGGSRTREPRVGTSPCAGPSARR